MHPAPTTSCSGRRAASCPSRCKSPRTSRSIPLRSGAASSPPRLSAGTSSSTSGSSPEEGHPLQRRPCAVPGGRPAQRLLPGLPKSHPAKSRLRAEHPPDPAVQGRPRDQQGHAPAHHRRHRSDAGPHPVPRAPGTAVQHGVLHPPPGVPVRQLTLNETFDEYGRLIQLLGTNQPVNGGFGRAYMNRRPRRRPRAQPRSGRSPT